VRNSAAILSTDLNKLTILVAGTTGQEVYMSTQATHIRSRNTFKSPANGLDDEAQPDSTERKYELEDFSQQAINRGQVEINYLLTVVNAKTDEALKQLRKAVAKLAKGGQVDFKALDKAIGEVYKANQKVAGPFPPGCLKSGGSGN
jgi:hypothetical protein